MSVRAEPAVSDGADHGELKSETAGDRWDDQYAADYRKTVLGHTDLFHCRVVTPSKYAEGFPERNGQFPTEISKICEDDKGACGEDCLKNKIYRAHDAAIQSL